MKNNMTWTLLTILVGLSLLLGACQSTESDITIAVNTALFADDKFLQYKNVAIETEEDIFTLDDDMRAMVSPILIPEKNIEKRATKLLHHIFSTENIGLSYESGANTTAIETYHSSQANCMSLTIMAYALAKEANLKIKFQEVEVPEHWVRNGRYSMLTGHVNLMVTRHSSRDNTTVWRKNNML